jgi:hypothetical protein
VARSCVRSRNLVKRGNNPRWAAEPEKINNNNNNSNTCFEHYLFIQSLYSFRPHHGPGLDSSSNRNEKYFLGDKGSRCVVLIALLTPWSRVLLEKLTGFQVGKKFPTFYGNGRYITAFKSAGLTTLPIHVPIFSKSGGLNPVEPSGTIICLYRDCFTSTSYVTPCGHIIYI